MNHLKIGGKKGGGDTEMCGTTINGWWEETNTHTHLSRLCLWVYIKKDKRQKKRVVLETFYRIYIGLCWQKIIFILKLAIK